MNKYMKITLKNGRTQCALCKQFCQGFKDYFGRILCSDCYFKEYGERPKE